MKDPRLTEISLLSDLEQQRVQLVNWVVDWDVHPTYGIGKDRYRELVLHCIINRYVNDTADLIVRGTFQGMSYSVQSIREALEFQATELARQFVDRQGHCSLRLSHEGRLRLWKLRDELNNERRLDPLGVLLSREFWERDLELAFAFLPRDQTVSVMIADMDNFKRVNDTCGHDVGDTVMKRYLHCFQDVIDRRGSAYRLGGDEVLAILPQSSGSDARVLAEAIRKNVESTMQFMDELKPSGPHLPTVSIGAKAYADRVEPADAYRAVDHLLQKAKLDGKNRVVVE